MIFNSEYPDIKNLAEKTAAQKIDYLKRCSVRDNHLCYGAEKIISLADIKLLGKHNLQNIMAAVCAAKLYRVPNAAIKRALAKFTNLDHRLEFVGRYKEISFYDDAISTTPESTLAALEVFQKKIGTIILGGEDRGYKFAALANRLAALKVANVVLFPASGQRIGQEIKKAYQRNHLVMPNILKTVKMEMAVKFAYQNTRAGQICLLSTASPSYSLFKNFISSLGGNFSSISLTLTLRKETLESICRIASNTTSFSSKIMALVLRPVNSNCNVVRIAL